MGYYPWRTRMHLRTSRSLQRDICRLPSAERTELLMARTGNSAPVEETLSSKKLGLLGVLMPGLAQIAPAFTLLIPVPPSSTPSASGGPSSHGRFAPRAAEPPRPSPPATALPTAGRTDVQIRPHAAGAPHSVHVLRASWLNPPPAAEIGVMDTKESNGGSVGRCQRWRGGFLRLPMTGGSLSITARRVELRRTQCHRLQQSRRAADQPRRPTRDRLLGSNDQADCRPSAAEWARRRLSPGGPETFRGSGDTGIAITARQV